jgi:cytochrome c553
MKALPKLILLTLPLALLAGCGQKSQPAAEAQSGKIDAGRVVAQAKCAACHGIDGASMGPDVPHLAGQNPVYMLSSLGEYKSGARPHAALQQLINQMSDEEAQNVVAYYASLKPINTAKANEGVAGDRLAAGKEAAAQCAACHGADGNSKVNGTPSLAGQHPAYIAGALAAYGNGARKDASMDKIAKGVVDTTAQNLGLFFTSQSPVSRNNGKGDAAKGEPLSGKCGGCHGQQGHSADGTTPALAGQDGAYLVKTMKDYRDGRRKHDEMHTQLAGVKDANLEHIAAFYSKQTPTPNASTKPTSGQQWADRCDKCHGPQTATAPLIDSQPVVYLARALKDYRDGKRAQSSMHIMSSPLTDADIDAVSAYYASIAPRAR